MFGLVCVAPAHNYHELSTHSLTYPQAYMPGAVGEHISQHDSPYSLKA